MSIEEKKETYASIKIINQLVKNKRGSDDEATAVLSDAKKQAKSIGKLFEEKARAFNQKKKELEEALKAQQEAEAQAQVHDSCFLSLLFLFFIL